MKKKDIQKKKGANNRTSENPVREGDTIKGAFLSATAAHKKSKVEANTYETKDGPKALSVRHTGKNSPGSDSTDSFEPVQTKEIQLVNFKFSPQSIKIACNTKIRWIVKENVSAYESGVYSTKERFFIIAINDLGIESDPLYRDNTFEHTFTTLGAFEIACANYPGIKGVVEVVSDLKDAYYNLHANYKDRYLFVERRYDEDNDKAEKIRPKKQKAATKTVSKTDSEDDCCLETRKNLFEIEPEILKEMISNLTKGKEGPQSGEKKADVREEEKERRVRAQPQDTSDDMESSDFGEESQGSNSESFFAQFFEKTMESVINKQECINTPSDSHESRSLEKVDEPLDLACNQEQAEALKIILLDEENQLEIKESDPQEDVPKNQNDEMACFPKPHMSFTDFINKTVQKSLDINMLLNVAGMSFSEEERFTHESAKNFLQSSNFFSNVIIPSFLILKGFELSSFFVKAKQKNPKSSENILE